MENNSYLSVTDILVTNEKIPCKFLHDLPKMGKYYGLIGTCIKIDLVNIFTLRIRSCLIK